MPVDVSSSEIEEQSARSRSWFTAMRGLAHEHASTPLLWLTTEKLVVAPPSQRRSLFSSLLSNSTVGDREGSVRLQSFLPRTTSWPQRAATSCDLCADQWVFVLATGRSGSTSIWEALNSLPRVSLAGENQGSLEVSSILLERYTEARVRNSNTNAASVGNWNELICAIQQWYRGLAGIEAREAPGRQITLGFKELLSLRPQSTFFDHENQLPPARHLPCDADDPEEPQWMKLLDTAFPCARIIFNVRSNTTAQAQSAFHKKQGTSPQDLDALNAIVDRLHAARGGSRSFHLALEDFSVAKFNQLAQWLELECKFVDIPRANVAGEGRGAEYHSDINHSRYRCSRLNRTLGRQVPSQH